MQIDPSKNLNSKGEIIPYESVEKFLRNTTCECIREGCYTTNIYISKSGDLTNARNQEIVNPADVTRIKQGTGFGDPHFTDYEMEVFKATFINSGFDRTTIVKDEFIYQFTLMKFAGALFPTNIPNIWIFRTSDESGSNYRFGVGYTESPESCHVRVIVPDDFDSPADIPGWGIDTYRPDAGIHSALPGNVPTLSKLIEDTARHWHNIGLQDGRAGSTDSEISAQMDFDIKGYIANQANQICLQEDKDRLASSKSHELRPSMLNFKPWDSVDKKLEKESHMWWFMNRLAENGDTFRELTFAEYQAMGGKGHESILEHFNKYIKSADTIVLYSPTYKEAADKLSQPLPEEQKS